MFDSAQIYNNDLVTKRKGAESYRARKRIKLKREVLKTDTMSSLRNKSEHARRKQMATIMLVDDSAFMRGIQRDILQTAGYRIVAEASDGEEAITFYELYKPDIILLDITMKKVSGLEALKQIIKQNPQAKAIMCSAMGQEGFIREAITKGAKDFLIKPFQPQTLLEAVSKVERR